MKSPSHTVRMSLLLTALALLVGGCRAIEGAEGDTADQKRATMRGEMQTTLNELYAARPEARQKVANAVGYGYFSNMNVNLILLSSENGYGLVHSNTSGKDTFMKVGGAGVGLGMGVKDYRAIF